MSVKITSLLGTLTLPTIQALESNGHSALVLQLRGASVVPNLVLSTKRMPELYDYCYIKEFLNTSQHLRGMILSNLEHSAGFEPAA